MTKSSVSKAPSAQDAYTLAKLQGKTRSKRLAERLPKTPERVQASQVTQLMEADPFPKNHTTTFIETYGESIMLWLWGYIADLANSAPIWRAFRGTDHEDASIAIELDKWYLCAVLWDWSRGNVTWQNSKWKDINFVEAVYREGAGVGGWAPCWKRLTDMIKEAIRKEHLRLWKANGKQESLEQDWLLGFLGFFRV